MKLVTCSRFSLYWLYINEIPLTPLQGDTCSSVRSRFDLSATQFSSLNPGLDCNNNPTLPVSQIVCVERDSARVGNNPPCTRSHRVEKQETCDYLRMLGLETSPQGFVTALSWLEFYRINPGIMCNSLTPPLGNALVGAEVRCRIQ